jgi:hypothetical protein
VPLRPLRAGTGLSSHAWFSQAEEGAKLLDFGTELIRGFYAFNALAIIACCLVFYARRRLWRRRQRLGKFNPGFFPTYTAAGNALQTLHAMTQQRVDYVLEEKFVDEADEDEEGGPPDPTKHLQRQLRRIRGGDRVDKLTALSPQ